MVSVIGILALRAIFVSPHFKSRAGDTRVCEEVCCHFQVGINILAKPVGYVYRLATVESLGHQLMYDIQPTNQRIYFMAGDGELAIFMPTLDRKSIGSTYGLLIPMHYP